MRIVPAFLRSRLILWKGIVVKVVDLRLRELEIVNFTSHSFFLERRRPMINPPTFARRGRRGEGRKNNGDKGVIHGRLERKSTESRFLARDSSVCAILSPQASKQLLYVRRTHAMSLVSDSHIAVDATPRTIASGQDYPREKIRALVTHIVSADGRETLPYRAEAFPSVNSVV